jgi:hypothetical protein
MISLATPTAARRQQRWRYAFISMLITPADYFIAIAPPRHYAIDYYAIDAISMPPPPLLPLMMIIDTDYAFSSLPGLASVCHYNSHYADYQILAIYFQKPLLVASDRRMSLSWPRYAT